MWDRHCCMGRCLSVKIQEWRAHGVSQRDRNRIEYMKWTSGWYVFGTRWGNADYGDLATWWEGPGLIKAILGLRVENRWGRSRPRLALEQEMMMNMTAWRIDEILVEVVGLGRLCSIDPTLSPLRQGPELRYCMFFRLIFVDNSKVWSVLSTQTYSTSGLVFYQRSFCSFKCKYSFIL